MLSGASAPRVPGLKDSCRLNFANGRIRILFSSNLGGGPVIYRCAFFIKKPAPLAEVLKCASDIMKGQAKIFVGSAGMNVRDFRIRKEEGFKLQVYSPGQVRIFCIKKKSFVK